LARGGGASRLFIPLQPNSDDDEFGGSSLKIEVCRKIVFVVRSDQSQRSFTMAESNRLIDLEHTPPTRRGGV
jgi:hypothetical protein